MEVILFLVSVIYLIFIILWISKCNIRCFIENFYHLNQCSFVIPDSPLIFNVIEGGTARAWGPGLSRVLQNSTAHFNVSCVSVCPPSRPEVSISGPAGTLPQPLITPKKQDHYEVAYTPTKVGIYDVTITCNGKHIPGKVILFN